MQDSYSGDIGDYGKYGLLRAVCSSGLTLSVNWYKVDPKQLGKQEDGKYINYLSEPQKYRSYDPTLFDALQRMIYIEKDRRIARVEQEGLFSAQFYSEPLGGNRAEWHRNALRETVGTDTIFLDPDNGLETKKMFLTKTATEKHVCWNELRDYYTRGQNVILYQHRPQMTTKEACINSVMQYQKDVLRADGVKLLEFPRYTNRFYFIFFHKEYECIFEKICNFMQEYWGKEEFCKCIDLR